MRYLAILIILVTVCFISGCNDEIKSLKVTATAYTSRVMETDSSPFDAAWGDTLTPEIKSIAISSDLEELGLTHGSDVRIEGLPGKYRVLDRMHARWEKKIDIYMGKDVEKAREWGKKKVVIQWVAD